MSSFFADSNRPNGFIADTIILLPSWLAPFRKDYKRFLRLAIQFHGITLQSSPKSGSESGEWLEAQMTGRKEQRGCLSRALRTSKNEASDEQKAAEKLLTLEDDCKRLANPYCTSSTWPSFPISYSLSNAYSWGCDKCSEAMVKLSRFQVGPSITADRAAPKVNESSSCPRADLTSCSHVFRCNGEFLRPLRQIQNRPFPHCTKLWDNSCWHGTKISFLQ